MHHSATYVLWETVEERKMRRLVREQRKGFQGVAQGHAVIPGRQPHTRKTAYDLWLRYELLDAASKSLIAPHVRSTAAPAVQSAVIHAAKG